MHPDTPLRDISTAPAIEPAPRLRRPDRRAAYRPASDEHPIVAAHGGLLTVERLGTVAYEPAWELQETLAARRRDGAIGDRLLLLEHFPVYTLGRGGDETNLIASPARLRELGATLVRIDRGGDITFHGPGQIVAYPIVELRDKLDLRRYVQTLQAAVIATAATFGVRAGLLPDHIGVWVDGERKLAAFGVRVRRGVTTHGLALNVNTDLRWFDEMIPCGIPDKDVTSLTRELGHPVDATAVEAELARQLAAHLGLRLAEGPDGVIGPAGGREQ